MMSYLDSLYIRKTKDLPTASELEEDATKMEKLAKDLGIVWLEEGYVGIIEVKKEAKT